MLKTMSAALLAVSVLAAPALATDSGKTAAGAPVIKTTQTKTGEVKNSDTKIGDSKAGTAASKVAKTAPAGIEGQKQNAFQASTTKPIGTQAKPAALNANAKMAKHHHRKHISYRHGHHGHQAKTTAMKTHTAAALKVAPKVGLRPATTKRG